MADVDYNIKLILDAQNNATKEIQGVSWQLSNLWKTLSWLWITKVFKDMSSSVLEYWWNLEQAQVAFSTLIWSEEKSNELLKDLSDFAKNTPFELVWVRDNARQLIWMWIEAENVIPTLKTLWDVSAWLSIDLSRVALNYWQVKSQWKLTGRELRDFAIMWIPLQQQLADSLWKTTEEIWDMVSKWLITFPLVEKAFQDMTSEWWKFENLMEKQSHTYQGMLSNLQDSFWQIKESIWMAILPLLEDLLAKISPIIEKVSDRIAEHQELAWRIALVIWAVWLLTWWLITLWWALPLVSAWLAALSWPVWIVIWAITALWLARATNFGWIKDKTQEVIDFVKPYIEEFITTIQAFWEEHWEQIKIYLQAFWDWIKFLIETAIEWVKLAFEWLFTALWVLLDIFQWDWEWAWEKIKKFWQQVAQTIDKIMTKAFWDMWTNIKNWILESYDWVVDKIGKLVNRIEKAVQRLKDAWNSAKERVSNAASTVSGWFGWWKAVWWPVYNWQTYLVWENWPELFTPSQNGRITRNEDLAFAGAGETNINISFGDVSINDWTDQQSLAETIASTITRQLELYKRGIY